MVETALASYLSPGSSERLEAALGRHLDRMNRQMERMEHHITITKEALALFVRFWLTTTPPLPDTAQAVEQGRTEQEGTASFGENAEALLRRVISPLSRSSGLMEWILSR